VVGGQEYRSVRVGRLHRERVARSRPDRFRRSLMKKNMILFKLKRIIVAS
jgi:hypothetical protein